MVLKGLLFSETSLVEEMYQTIPGDGPRKHVILFSCSTPYRSSKTEECPGSEGSVVKHSSVTLYVTLVPLSRYFLPPGDNPVAVGVGRLLSDSLVPLSCQWKSTLLTSTKFNLRSTSQVGRTFHQGGLGHSEERVFVVPSSTSLRLRDSLNFSLPCQTGSTIKMSTCLSVFFPFRCFFPPGSGLETGESTVLS